MGDDVDTDQPLSKLLVLDLLRPKSLSFVLPEEEIHPWRPDLVQTLDSKLPPLLRIWDRFSGSRPDANNRMLARAPRYRLDTKQLRYNSLAGHLHWRNWDTPTPYISFTSCPQELKRFADFRSANPNRRVQVITLIDPNIRVRKGLPVLNVIDQMENYQIQDPYSNSNRYYKDEYVCLWEITPEEVVSHWTWDTLSRNPNWYRDIVMPAYRQHELDHEVRALENARANAERLSGISGLMETLSINEDAADVEDEHDVSDATGEEIEESPDLNDVSETIGGEKEQETSLEDLSKAIEKKTEKEISSDDVPDAAEEKSMDATSSDVKDEDANEIKDEKS